MTSTTSQLPALTRRRFITVSAMAAAATATAFTPLGRGMFTARAQESGVAFLGSDRVHDITVTFDQAEYDAMIQAYIDTEDKEWLSATVTIDGSTYEQVGLRLKGNSSLMGLRMQPGGDFGGAQRETESASATPVAGAEGAATEDATTAVIRGAGGLGGDISADEPESLPWLIRLDKYVDDQTHNGIENLVIRSNRSETALNEALALDLLDAAGLASQRAAATSFTVNGRAPKLRLAIELPDDPWMERHFSDDGLLYKAEATGDYSYRGDDPTSYVEVFELEAGGTKDDAADMAPLIAFLEFINDSDDTTFVAELPQRLDVAGFATYLAMMDLIQNTDDIDGPGNNSYLYIAPETEQVTIVPWDMNLAFGSMGGMQGAPGDGQFTMRGPGDAAGPPLDGELPVIVDASGTPVAIDDVVRGADMPSGMGGMGAMGGRANPLVERFTAVADYATLVTERTAALRAELYDSGAAATLLSTWVGVLTAGASSLVPTETIAAEAEQLTTLITGT